MRVLLLIALYFSQHRDHLDGRLGRAPTGVTVPPARAIQRLLASIGRQNSEDHRQPMIQPNPRQPGGALPGNKIKVRRLSANHRPQTNHRRDSPSSRQRLRRQRQLERPRNLANLHAILIDAQLRQSLSATRQQSLHDLAIKPRRRNRHAHPARRTTSLIFRNLSAHAPKVRPLAAADKTRLHPYPLPCVQGRGENSTVW